MSLVLVILIRRKMQKKTTYKQELLNNGKTVSRCILLLLFNLTRGPTKFLF